MATAADSTSNSPSRASAGSRRKSLPPGILQGQPPDSQFGACVAAAGDVNRDGYADVFVSAPGYDPDRGEALVFLGSTNGFKNRLDWTVEGDQAGEHFGSGATGLGDVNGEFGRTPYAENRKDQKVGRDHHHTAFSMLRAGGDVRGGVTYGASDELGMNTVENPVHVHDLHATILHLLGLDHEKLTYRYAGRDFRLTDVSGNAIKALLA